VSIISDLPDALADVRRPGDFYVSGTCDWRAPALSVAGVGPVAFPLLEDLAKRLIADLTQKKFDPAKYHDHYRERVMGAAQRKLEGEEVVEVPVEGRKGKVIDLMAALKASLEKRGFAVEEGEPAQRRAGVSAGKAASAHGGAARTTERTRGGGKK